MNYTSINNQELSFSYQQRLRVYWLETKFEWLKTIRNPSFALPAILFPAIFYLFFGVLVNQNNVEAATYLLSTYGTFGVMGPALFSFGSGLAVERGKGWLDIKSISPMPASALILSRVLVSMAFSVMIVLILGAIAFFVAGVSLTAAQYVTLLVTLVIGGLPFCLLGLCMGLTLKAESAAAIVNAVYLPLSFLSGLWLPINMLPGFLQSIASYLPPYHLSQLALKVTGQDMGGNVLNHLAMLVLFSAIFFILAMFLFNKRQK